MGGSRLGMLVSSVGLGASTVLSKFLGLFRDILVAAALGTSPAAGAWVMALIAPNLFRRIFGEGAVGTAMVPMLAESMIKPEGRAYAALQLRTILLTVCAILLVIAALGIVIPFAVVYFFPVHIGNYQGLLAVSIPAAMPYAVFICMAGVATAALNVDKQFFWSGMSGLLFNLCTIGLLLWVDWADIPWKPDFLLVMMCLSVTFSGVLQLIWILLLLSRRGLLAPRIYRDLPWKSTLTDLWKLSLPAVLGSSALQVSMLLDWMLANWLGGAAVASLSYAEHIAFLPTSAVALSLGVVGLAHMTTAYAAGEMKELKAIFNFGMRYVLFISIPMAVFTVIFSEEIVQVLFQRRRFDAESVRETVMALQYLAFGIPFFCILKVVTAGFQARKDMVTPMKVSFWAIGINVICSLCLMWHFRQGGIAIAMIVSSLINNGVLLVLLHRRIGSYGIGRIFWTVLRSGLCALGAALPFVWLWPYLPAVKVLSFVSVSGLPLFLSGIGFVGLYFGFALALRTEEVRPILRRIGNRWHRR